MSADSWGIDESFYDALGALRTPSAATRQAIQTAMGGQPAGSDAVCVLRAGETLHVGPGELTIEQGGSLRIEGQLPSDLPTGYHELLRADQPPLRVIVSPGSCYFPPEMRIWGWAVQLYGVRSKESWGIGELRDLRRLGEWSATLGASVLLTNPLHAPAPTLPQEASPYYASSRMFRNPLYLCLEEVPGYGQHAAELEPLAVSGRALLGQRLIDRDQIYRLKLMALEKLWGSFGGNPAFDDYCKEQGEKLVRFTAYCALAEQFGANWRQWPTEYRRHDSAVVGRFVSDHARRVRYFAWLQWLLDVQVARANDALALVQDLPIGSEPDGADTWAWQDVLAEGIAIGAPPDLFNAWGQNWGLPPLVPQKLRVAGYQPFVDVLRANFRHSGGLRIDHALGLFRLYWIPHGCDATQGAYVRYPTDDLLAILALESQRAGAFVVGEDLGTAEPGVRGRLSEHDILSYALMWFEERPPREYPRKVLAAVTTHDLPTIAGLWSGSDLAEQQHLGLRPSEVGQRRMLEHLARVAGLEPQASVDTAIDQAYSMLAQADSAVLIATLEDALAVCERPNIPNTTTGQRLNWSLALPYTLDQILGDPRPRRLAKGVGSRFQRR